MEGIITFYINFHPDLGQDVEKTIEIFKQTNKDLIDSVNKDSGYRVAVVPTTKEACRIEKIDFNKPFPRFVSRMHTDIVELEKRKEERAAERACAKKEERNRDQKED
jgi:hypothetical protein